MPRIIPEPRYFSMPSIEVGADVRKKRALNCWPWVWSLTHSPDAVIHSPAAMMAAWPITVTRSRWPRAFARSTQKPFSLLWNVTRSTRPASISWVDGSRGGFIYCCLCWRQSHPCGLDERGRHNGPRIEPHPACRQGLEGFHGWVHRERRDQERESAFGPHRCTRS